MSEPFAPLAAWCDPTTDPVARLTWRRANAASGRPERHLPTVPKVGNLSGPQDPRTPDFKKRLFPRAPTDVAVQLTCDHHRVARRVHGVIAVRRPWLPTPRTQTANPVVSYGDSVGHSPSGAWREGAPRIDRLAFEPSPVFGRLQTYADAVRDSLLDRGAPAGAVPNRLAPGVQMTGALVHRGVR